MSDYQDEKTEEKEMQKSEEKSSDEKNFDEKWRRDPIGMVVWAFILIWAGVVFLLDNIGVLDNLIPTGAQAPDGLFLEDFGPWSLVFLGAGVILLLEVLIRLTMPEYRRSIIGTLVFALIFLGIGLGDIFTWDLFWPIILIILGASIVLRGILRGRK